MSGLFARVLTGVFVITLSLAGCKKPAPSDAPPADGGPVTGISQQDVKRVVREQRAAMEKCHDEALVRNPATSGKLELVFAVLRDGTVDKPSAGLAGEAKDPLLAKCVLDVVVTLKFPTGGAITDVQLPIDLGKRGDAGVGVAAPVDTADAAHASDAAK